MHRFVEESLLLACTNLGKNVIQQTLQQELVPFDGTKDVLSGACQALAEDILKTVQLKIWENGSVTQKEVLSYACRSLATLIKTQCPRGAGETIQLNGDLGYALSESLLAMKLADVINIRELVECVCSRHDEGLKTVLLAACQWMLNDIKALFLCEEVCSNLFTDEQMICAEFYRQLRPLLNVTVFQIKLGAQLDAEHSPKLHLTEDVPKKQRTLHTTSKIQCEGKNRHRGGEPGLHPMDAQQVRPNYGRSNVFNQAHRRLDQYSNSAAEKGMNTKQYIHHQRESSIIINNRETFVTYILDLINAKGKQRCYATILKLWRLLTQTDAFVCSELFEERLCYLITFRTNPLHAAHLLAFSSFGDPAFEADVKVQEIGRPIWPKDTSVVKRWFPYQEILVSKDSGNQCLQIWRIGSKKVERRRPKPIVIYKPMESEDSSINGFRETPEMLPKRTVGCFAFSKSRQTLDDDDDYY